MDTEAHLTAGYCAATGTYSSRHPPLATADAASFPDYRFPRLLTFPPDRPAFVDASTGSTLSFPDLRTLSLKAAAALSALGLRRGHVALLLVPSSLHFQDKASMEGPDIANNPNNNQQSFQDKASMEGVAPQAQSASDQHDQNDGEHHHVPMCDLSPSLHGNGDGGVESSNEPPTSISIGRLVPSTEARVVDVESGESLPPNRVGELWIRGPSVMQGYLRREEATAAALVTDDGGRRWLRTGDLCYVDSHGLVHVVDRIKELIKYKAYQVAPAELEDVLAAHPDIRDAAVAPYPDEEAGEIPMACVVRKPGSNQPQAQDAISFVQSKVAPYKKVRKSGVRRLHPPVTFRQDP
ncbi:putative 4-coumarate--CoA ligase-like 8 [Panicum virgatum]|uniref:putative 4-coumarate--CoA ligase-like 8 n=1 Tax=Panicum virgatum TaxID=38727 RepID=UPI0019D5F6E8|nr:putative 4-coumarate--CoA ligase-like 8 [Panicum virgatum]